MDGQVIPGIGLDGMTDASRDGWIDDRTDGFIDRWIDRLMEGCLLEIWMDRLTQGRMNGRMDAWTEAKIDRYR